MSGQVLTRQAAKEDLAEHARYIAEDSVDTALRFLDAAERDFMLLAANPKAGSPTRFAHPLLKQVRTWPIKGFTNHVIYYRPIAGGIEIIRVLHGARDMPGVFLEGRDT